MNINMIDEATEPVLFAKAMADETRQRVMSLLCCRWLCVGDIVDELGGISQPTVSHHLAVLREAGLVHVRREGKQVFYSLDQDKVAVCCGLIMRVFAPERVDVPLSAVAAHREG
jgi:DNA-binding transcriptional ArsR family regulator